MSPSSGCWCDDKANEPCDWICRLLRDHERLREAAQALVDAGTYDGFYGTEAQQVAAVDALERLRAVLAGDVNQGDDDE